MDCVDVTVRTCGCTCSCGSFNAAHFPQTASASETLTSSTDDMDFIDVDDGNYVNVIDGRSTVDNDETNDIIAVSECSKREYLLAQIRQKDAIIESLLKQVSAREAFIHHIITRVRE